MKGKVLSLLFFLSLVCCNLHAMDPCHQSVVYLFEDTIGTKDGWGRGSGVVVKELPGGGCLILTAAHVITVDGVMGGGVVDPDCKVMYARFADGSVHRITYVKHSVGGVDLALYRCEEHSVDAVKIADGPAEAGDMLYLQGAPHRPDGTRNYEFECNDLTWRKETAGNGECWTGESGTAILNSDGELVSILTGGWRAVKRYDGTYHRRSHPGNPFVQSQKVYPIVGMSTPEIIREFVKTEITECRFEVHSGGRWGYDKKLVIFSASWCMPCKELKKRIKSMLPELAKAGINRVIYVDCDEFPSLRDKYNVKSYPSVYLSESGKSRKLFTGLKSKQDILEKLR